MTKFDWSLPGGKLVQDVNEVVLANNTAKTIDHTVPSGKRWYLLNIKVTNVDDVSRTVSIYKALEAAFTNVLRTYDAVSVGAGGTLNFPRQKKTDGSENAVPQVNSMILDVLENANTIRVVWAAGGASAGGTDADGLVLEYLEVDV